MSVGQTPAEWAATVRATYDLDATDEQLVMLGESALGLSIDQTVAPHVRMTASGRFQAIVRQLALVARRDQARKDEAPAVTAAEEPKKRPERVAPRSGVDPRTLLMAVK